MFLGERMKKVYSIVRRIVLSIIILYCVNLIIYTSSVVIPINYASVGILSLLGLPGLISLLVIYFII